jgi:hypothetical protein
MDKLRRLLTELQFQVETKTWKDGQLGATYGLETKWTSPLSLPWAPCSVLRAYARYTDALEQSTMIGAPPNAL